MWASFLIKKKKKNIVYNCKIMDILFHIANYLHAVAMLTLLINIWCNKTCAGLSGKTQFLYALVYTTRYLDVFTVFLSVHNTALKILYSVFAYCTILSIYGFFRKTYERKYDTFRIELLVIPCLIIAILLNHEFTALEVLWTFSTYLEAVVIIPQFHFISNANYIHKYVKNYIIMMGIYKYLYLMHWAYRYYEERFFDNIALAAGIIYFLLYCDFFARIMLRLKNKPETEPQVAVIDIVKDNATDGSSLSKGGQLNSNISSIVLLPSSLADVKENKEHLIKSEEGKY